MAFDEMTDEVRSSTRTVGLVAAEIEVISRLLFELRDITLSRSTFQAATELLKRFGYDATDVAVVRPETRAR